MKMTATIDNIALAALVFAVVAISAVSTVAVVSAENLIFTNEKILRAQRIISSLDSIRFNALSLDIGEQNYIITGNERDLGRYRSGTVEIEGELVYLAGKREEYSALSQRFVELDSLARQFIADERKIVDARRTQGFAAAQSMVRDHIGDALQEKLLGLAHQLLAQARREQDSLEADQISYGDKVRRLILALISSSAFILVFLYGTLRRLNLEQRAAQMRIAHQATHDSLTDLFNRPALMEHISLRLRNAETEAALGGFALLLVDLDGFKSVNDNLGHDAGDALLKEVARRTRGALRDSDYLSRLGGDEFLIVIPQVSDQETAENVAKKLISVIAQPYVLGIERAQVTASIGVSLFPRDGRQREDLMKSADVALYQAKRAGKNCVRFYDAALGGNSRF
ncbi:MAG: diguanylate cyclase [Betaproteobacteria bacterium]